jgi:hypothetical protein
MMGKKNVKIQLQDTSPGACITQVKQALGPNCACCVLISCSDPAADGKMQVELHFEGEESLAAFLVESAAQIFDDRCATRDVK